jgi:hypothetical protein
MTDWVTSLTLSGLSSWHYFSFELILGASALWVLTDFTANVSHDLPGRQARKCGGHRNAARNRSNDDRPRLVKALAFVRPSDVLVVWKLDRLGRSLSHLLSIVNALKEKQVASF